MREVVEQLRELLATQRPVAYCRLVETRGSTPQKAGALMLVLPDGSQCGTLGGGCVEAEVKRRALGIIDAGQPEIARFQLDHDYGWDDGLICGGRMQILIDPILNDESRAYYSTLAEQVARCAGVTEAIVFDGRQGVPIDAGSFLFDDDGELLAARRSGVSSDIVRQLAEALKPLKHRPRPYVAGGVAYLPVLKRCRLVIVGGGHVGKAVADLAADLDFDVWVIDDRAEYVREDRFPRATRRIAGPIPEVLKNLEVDQDTYCLIVTRGHNHDEEALYHLAERPARYIGMIGSRRKIRMIFEDLLNEGISAESLERVYAPLGIDIGSQTVPEIAVSICAELVSHRNREGVVPGRPEAVALPR